ncbi:hypothetical protein ACF0H5_007713 [Mactra antiquata]
MECLQGRKICVIFCILILIQLILTITLTVYGTLGQSEMSKSDTTGVPYYIGAFITSGVYYSLVIGTGVMLLLYYLDVDTGSGAMYCTVCLLMYLGLPTFLLSMVFTVVFGIADCKTDATYDRSGSCSYRNNIDENYRIATICLVLIILLFLTNLVGIFLLCNFGDPSDSAIVSTAVPSGGSNKRGNSLLNTMQKDRERRNDVLKQIRMGVPPHRVVEKPRF